MGRATPVELTVEERQTLERWSRAGSTEQRFAQRARLILDAGGGLSTTEIAKCRGVRAATVSKWRTRFARERVSGLEDRARPGPRPKYDEATERRVLSCLDGPPPAGYATWNGPLVSEALGDVPEHQVWRILRKHAIQLQRRRSWCVSTDPEFAAKAADVVGLYPEPARERGGPLGG